MHPVRSSFDDKLITSPEKIDRAFCTVVDDVGGTAASAGEVAPFRFFSHRQPTLLPLNSLDCHQLRSCAHSIGLARPRRLSQQPPLRTEIVRPTMYLFLQCVSSFLLHIHLHEI